MALSYPHKETFDENSKELAFEDGFEISVPSGAFAQAVEITIDKVDPADSDGTEALTAAYTFSTESGQPPELGKELMFRVPALVSTTVSTALTLRTNPGEIPAIDEWTPRPDVAVGRRDGKLVTNISELSTFQITK